MEDRHYTIELAVDGKKIGLNKFVRSVFINVTTGMVLPLKNIGDPEEIVVRLKRTPVNG